MVTSTGIGSTPGGEPDARLVRRDECCVMAARIWHDPTETGLSGAQSLAEKVRRVIRDTPMDLQDGSAAMTSASAAELLPTDTVFGSSPTRRCMQPRPTATGSSLSRSAGVGHLPQGRQLCDSPVDTNRTARRSPMTRKIAPPSHRSKTSGSSPARVTGRPVIEPSMTMGCALRLGQLHRRSGDHRGRMGLDTTTVINDIYGRADYNEDTGHLKARSKASGTSTSTSMCAHAGMATAISSVKSAPRSRTRRGVPTLIWAPMSDESTLR